MAARGANAIKSYRLFSTIRSASPYHNRKHTHISQRIVNNTQISRSHLTPEIALRLITPECRLFHEPVTENSERVFENDPFWGFYWPGGQALSRFILDNPELVQSKKILDIGSGCGATSIAAVMAKAETAVANDIDSVASVAVQMNAELNGVKVDTSEENLIGNTAIDEDVVLLGDLFYDTDFVETLLPWLFDLNKKGKTIYVGDPGRHGLTENGLKFMWKLATYELTENCCIENNGFKFVHVWKFM